MRQTLIYLPEVLAGFPVFGVGWVLCGLVVVGGIVLARSATQFGWRGAIQRWGPTLLIAALAVVYIAPQVERMRPVTPDDALPGNGLPIRGYGVMLVVAAISSVALAARRAAKAGIDPERIFDLAVPFFICGLIGARATFMLQHRQQYQFHSVWDFVRGFVNIAEGGLVVYGSLIGALLACWWFSARHRIPKLVLADVLAPCLVLGLAAGRIGCFLNGCCWGGLGDQAWCVHFPRNSPPYANQLRNGELWGLDLAIDSQPGVMVRRVFSDSPADRAGIVPGTRIVGVNHRPLRETAGTWGDRLEVLGAQLDVTTGTVRLELADGSTKLLNSESLPSSSRSVHPTQLYSALDALVLLGLLLAYEPFRRRPGEIFALTFTLHPVSRFLLEVIRDDEGTLWGTGLTPSQLLSIAIFLAAIGLWIYLWKCVPRSTPRSQHSVPQVGSLVR
ncbi:MAG TPA: prolipoprotein diacylglyceryl transferase family protein [Pirellulaceae bacterium]